MLTSFDGHHLRALSDGDSDKTNKQHYVIMTGYNESTKKITVSSWGGKYEIDYQELHSDWNKPVQLGHFLMIPGVIDFEVMEERQLMM